MPKAGEIISGGGDRWRPFGGWTEERLMGYIKDRFPRWEMAEPAVPMQLRQAELMVLYDPEEDPGGACLLKCRADKASEIVSVYPFSRLGGTHPVQIDEVIYDEDGVEAVLSGSIVRDEGDPLPVSFFDTHFHLNQHAYAIGSPNILPFHLTVFALSAQRPHQTSMEMEKPRWADEVGLQADENGMVRLDVSQLCAWLPGAPGAADAAKYRGEVVGLKRLTPTLLDTQSWLYNVVINRLVEDISLDFIVTERAMGGEPPFELGEYIEGIAWVQGRLADRPA